MGRSPGGRVEKAVTLPVVWLPEADAEFREALVRYECIRPELARRFAAAVTRTVEEIAAGPRRYAVIERGMRRAGVHRFPAGCSSCGKKRGSW